MALNNSIKASGCRMLQVNKDTCVVANLITCPFIYYFSMPNKTTLLILGAVVAVFIWLGFMRNTGSNSTGSATSGSQQPMFIPRTPPPMPGSQPAVNQPVTPTPKSNVQAASSPINPEHGKPGHRCDIAVGAPLGSAPATPASQTNQAVVTAPPQPAAQTKTPAGINPPHGQPGHRCDIAVGAPLNSKPAPAPQTKVQQVQQPAANAIQAKPVTAAQQALVQNTQAAEANLLPATPKGKNPPHGQPGHKCELPIGADLDSAARAKKQ